MVLTQSHLPFGLDKKMNEDFTMYQKHNIDLPRLDFDHRFYKLLNKLVESLMDKIYPPSVWGKLKVPIGPEVDKLLLTFYSNYIREIEKMRTESEVDKLLITFYNDHAREIEELRNVR